MSLVIGLTGYAGSGKSTVAQYLVERHGFTRLSFAAPLKKMLRTLDPMLGTDDRINGRGEAIVDHVHLSDLQGLSENAIKASPWGGEYRRLLQVLGTDCIRAVDEHFWVNAATAQMTDPDGKYVFDDCRFPNEAEVIKAISSSRSLWFIERPGYAAVNGHESEKHAGNMGEGQHIFNGSDLELLHAKIDGALTHISRVTAG